MQSVLELKHGRPGRAGRLNEDVELELGFRALIYNFDISFLTFLLFHLKIFL